MALAFPEAAPTMAIPPLKEFAARQAATTTPVPSTTPGLPAGYFISTMYITIDGVTNDHLTLAPKTIAIPMTTCSRSLTPDENGYLPPGTCGALWSYYPSFGAAAGFAALFAILTAVHIWQAIKYKKVSPLPFWMCAFFGLVLSFFYLRHSVGSSLSRVSGRRRPIPSALSAPGISRALEYT